jgi:hypothetical protein
VAPQHHRADVFDRNACLTGKEKLEAPRVEHAGHADDLRRVESGDALELVHHHVERVRHHDHERLRAVLLEVVPHVADDLQINGQQVVTRHPRLARYARGDDDDVRTGAVGPVRRAGDARIQTQDGAVLLEVQRLAFGDAFLFGDVEQHDVAQFLAQRERRQLTTDVPGADQSNLVPAWHSRLLLVLRGVTNSR